jgi:hypothetical protein
MAVRVLLTSGGQRIIPSADGARADGPFFLITRLHPAVSPVETVLTLLNGDVVEAEILKDDLVIGRVRGSGHSPK